MTQATKQTIDGVDVSIEYTHRTPRLPTRRFAPTSIAVTRSTRTAL